MVSEYLLPFPTLSLHNPHSALEIYVNIRTQAPSQALPLGKADSAYRLSQTEWFPHQGGCVVVSENLFMDSH